VYTGAGGADKEGRSRAHQSEEARRTADTSVIGVLSLGEADRQQHPQLHVEELIAGEKKQPSRRDLKKNTACLAFAVNSLSSAAPRDTAGWQRASQSFQVSQSRGPEGVGQSHSAQPGAEGWKNGACFPPRSARPFFNDMDTPAVQHWFWLALSL